MESINSALQNHADSTGSSNAPSPSIALPAQPSSTASYNTVQTGENRPTRTKRPDARCHEPSSALISRGMGVSIPDKGGSAGLGLFNRLSGIASWESVRKIRPVLSRIRSVSFSYYAEDLLLYHLQPQNEGFYVDVGAFHPQTHSNTYKLYLKGWHGVTVEPNPDMAPAFKSVRPRDTHLTIGIAANASHLTYYRFEDAPRNTFDADFVNHVDSPRRDEVQVPCVPLSAVFDEHCAGRQVDLISIDCENRDLEVATSLDWSRHRPTVVIIEDFEQFSSGANAAAPPGAIRSFFASRDYALAAQAFFSSIYVDRHGFATTSRKAGFRLDQSQFTGLAI